MSSSPKSKSPSGSKPADASRRLRRAEPHSGTPGGAKLRAVREQARRSQLWIEAEADLGTGYVQRVESGRVAQPGRATVERILDALSASYSERRDVLELFGYVVSTPLPTPDEVAWAWQGCQRELHDIPFPAYVLDCLPRLIAWNRFVPYLLGDEGSRAEAVLEGLVGRSMLAPWFDLTSPFGALVAEPDVLLPVLVRAMRFEIERFRNEPWLAEMLAQMQADLPRFHHEWTRAEQEPAPISAARILVPVRSAVPGAGLLQFRLVSEPFVRDTRFRLIYYVPADPVTMRQCAAWATDEQTSAEQTSS